MGSLAHYEVTLNQPGRQFSTVIQWYIGRWHLCRGQLRGEAVTAVGR